MTQVKSDYLFVEIMLLNSFIQKRQKRKEILKKPNSLKQRKLPPQIISHKRVNEAMRIAEFTKKFETEVKISKISHRSKPNPLEKSKYFEHLKPFP